MATCDPQTLLNDGSCFLCLSEKELNVAVAQLLCDIASGGVPCACENLGGADSPLNNITPDFIGQVYVQDSGVVWQAGSLLSSSWTVLCDPSGGGGGMIWGPDATELDFFVWSNQSFDTNGTITSLEFPSLTSVVNDFDFSLDSSLTSVSAPLLESASVIDGSVCSLLSLVNFESLTQADTVNLSQCPSLVTVDFTSLATIDEFVIYSCALTSLALPLLTGAVNGFDCSINLLTDLSLPNYTTGEMNCASNQLASLSLPAFSSGELECFSNQLTSLSLPSLISSTSLDFSDNQIVTVSCPQLVLSSPGGYVNGSNNALNATSVEFLLHLAVLAGFANFDTLLLDGGTNAGLASLSVQGQADYATLFAAGVNITINP